MQPTFDILKSEEFYDSHNLILLCFLLFL